MSARGGSLLAAAALAALLPLALAALSGADAGDGAGIARAQVAHDVSGAALDRLDRLLQAEPEAVPAIGRPAFLEAAPGAGARVARTGAPRAAACAAAGARAALTARLL